jgi:hypothetical protein
MQQADRHVKRARRALLTTLDVRRVQLVYLARVERICDAARAARLVARTCEATWREDDGETARCSLPLGHAGEHRWRGELL